MLSAQLVVHFFMTLILNLMQILTSFLICLNIYFIFPDHRLPYQDRQQSISFLLNDQKSS